MNLKNLFEGYPDASLSPWNDQKVKESQKSSKFTFLYNGFFCLLEQAKAKWIDRMRKLPLQVKKKLAKMVID